jgi:hypothetical protein
MSTSRATWRRRSRSSSALLFLALVVAGCGAAARTASQNDGRAGLAYTRFDGNGEHPSVWVAHADGSNARELVAKGWSGELSPDGLRITYLAAGKTVDEQPRLHVQNLDGGKPQLLGGHEAHAVWSPDEAVLAVSDQGRLSLVDPESGKSHELVRSDVRDISFAPDGKALVYAKGDGRPGHEFESDLFVVRLSDGKVEQLTEGGRSDRPVWGRDWIAFRHFRFVNEDHWPSIGELRLMRPDGDGDHLFARGDEDTSMAHYGVEPVDFSADGKRLLACYSREFGCPPVTFTIPDGKRYELAIRGLYINAADLASDGSEVLVNSGLIEGPYDVYSLPFEGGSARLLAKGASAANWADGG